MGELIINYQYDLVRNFESVTSNNLEYKLQESNEIEYNNVNDFNLNSKTSSIKTVSEYSEDTLVEEMDTVTFGTYINFYGSAGYKKEPIEWIVLDKQDDKVLLLSKNIIDWRRYVEKLSNTWETCSLRK